MRRDLDYSRPLRTTRYKRFRTGKRPPAAAARPWLKSRRGRILVTGFGPFPGVARNASAELALRLGGIVLPTEWAAPPPDMAGYAGVLHIGVSRRARGLVIECSAWAGCRRKGDAAGCLPCAAAGVHGVAVRPGRQVTPFPAARIVTALRRAGHAARLSHDPGRYLCNFVYRRTLMAGMPALFVHIPPRPIALPHQAAALRRMLAMMETAL